MKNSNSSTGVKVCGASILLEIDLGHNYYRETKRKLSYQWIHVQQNVIFMVGLCVWVHFLQVCVCMSLYYLCCVYAYVYVMFVIK